MEDANLVTGVETDEILQEHLFDQCKILSGHLQDPDTILGLPSLAQENETIALPRWLREMSHI